jgi:hypothetical protein
MTSGDHRPSRGRSTAEDPAQASLDGLLPPDAPDEAPTAKSRAEAPRRASRRAAKASGNAAKASGNDAEALRDSLDRLEQNVTLLLARHGEILAARRDADERRAKRKALDPLELQDRVRALEEERERLDRHAAFLEDRIRGLLSRVRYVVES